MEQGIFLQSLSDGLEESNNKVTIKLPEGSSIIANNHFWLHGRKPFKENKDLSRELLRIRGFFFKKFRVKKILFKFMVENITLAFCFKIMLKLAHI